MKYQHYKGGVYELVGAATHTESREMLIVYRDTQGSMWARPAGMFFGTVEINGVEVPRFTPVSAPKESGE